MALISITMNSAALSMNTTVRVCFPEMTGMDRGKPYPYDPNVRYQTLWLLHGGGGDSSDWVRKTNIERYANEAKLIVVCPSSYNSLYSDMHYGDKYYTYITEELPRMMKYFFPISDKREDNFVAGLSMGGYGALKWAMNRPEMFAYAGSFSGAVDMTNILKENHLHDGVLDRNFLIAFGSVDKVENTYQDVLYMANKNVAEGKLLPKFYLTCGTEDFCYKFNVNARNVFNELGIDYTWDERPGNHTWDYWDAAVQRYINLLPLTREPIFTAEEGN